MNHRRSSRCLGLPALLAGCALFTACVGATRLPARSRGPAGAQIQTSELDMSFLETAPVSRDDVSSKLASIDTGYHDSHLFWGRWFDSRWGYWWVVVAAGPGSPAAGAGDAKRVWHVKNLLITFDDNSVMQKREVIDNDHILWRELHAHVAAMPPLDLSQPEYLVLDNPNARSILLHSDYLEVTGEKKGPTRISTSSITRVDHESTKDKRENAGTTCHTLYFSEKTAVGRKLKFCGNAQMVVTLFEYLQETAPAMMQWE